MERCKITICVVKNKYLVIGVHMKKNYLFGIITGIVMYIILHTFFNLSRIFTIPISFVIAFIVWNYLRIYKLRTLLNNLNKFVNITDQSFDRMVNDKNELKLYVHDLKYDLLEIRDLLQKNDINKVKIKIEDTLLECAKHDVPSLCKNVYVDSFLTDFVLNHPSLTIDVKVDIPEIINIKVMDLSSFILCLLNENLIRESGKMSFHMIVKNNELITHITYPDKINNIEDDSQLILKAIVKKYHGEIIIENNHIKCILFLN